MKFTKNTAEVYSFEGLDHGVWAKFTVEDLGESGRISIASDYGDWQNGWGRCGMPFKAFLCDLDCEYAARKFGAGKWFDSEKTVIGYRKDVLLWRKENSITKELARGCFKELGYLHESDETNFCMQLERECPSLMKLYEYCPNLSHGVSPHFKLFWEQCWSLFITELKREQVQVTV